MMLGMRIHEYKAEVHGGRRYVGIILLDGMSLWQIPLYIHAIDRTVLTFYSFGVKNSTTAIFTSVSEGPQFGAQERKDKPCLNSSGFSEITQWPASISASSNLGKNLPMIGSASSGT